MVLRQDMKARLKKYAERVNAAGPSNYVTRYDKQSCPKKVAARDGVVSVLGKVQSDIVPDTQAVLAKVERYGALRLTVEDSRTGFEFSKLYFSPIEETHEEYFLDCGKFMHEGKEYEAVAADIFDVVGFDIWDKYYLLKPDDFGLRDEVVFRGVAELVSQNGNTLEALSKNMDLGGLKYSFEPMNKFYAKFDADGIKIRRNVFLLPLEE